MYAVSQNISGMYDTAGIATDTAGNYAGSQDVTAACSIFGAAFRAAVQVFSEQTSQLGLDISNAKITYINNDRHAASLVPRVIPASSTQRKAS